VVASRTYSKVAYGQRIVASRFAARAGSGREDQAIPTIYHTWSNYAVDLRRRRARARSSVAWHQPSLSKRARNVGRTAPGFSIEDSKSAAASGKQHDAGDRVQRRNVGQPNRLDSQPPPAIRRAARARAPPPIHIPVKDASKKNALRKPIRKPREEPILIGHEIHHGAA